MMNGSQPVPTHAKQILNDAVNVSLGVGARLGHKVEHQADFSLLDTLRRIEAKEDQAKQHRPPSRV